MTELFCKYIYHLILSLVVPSIFGDLLNNNLLNSNIPNEITVEDSNNNVFINLINFTNEEIFSIENTAVSSISEGFDDIALDGITAIPIENENFQLTEYSNENIEVNKDTISDIDLSINNLESVNVDENIATSIGDITDIKHFTANDFVQETDENVEEDVEVSEDTLSDIDFSTSNVEVINVDENMAVSTDDITDIEDFTENQLVQDTDENDEIITTLSNNDINDELTENEDEFTTDYEKDWGMAKADNYTSNSSKFSNLSNTEITTENIFTVEISETTMNREQVLAVPNTIENFTSTISEMNIHNDNDLVTSMISNEVLLPITEMDISRSTLNQLDSLSNFSNIINVQITTQNVLTVEISETTMNQEELLAIPNKIENFAGTIPEINVTLNNDLETSVTYNQVLYPVTETNISGNSFNELDTPMTSKVESLSSTENLVSDLFVDLKNIKITDNSPITQVITEQNDLEDTEDDIAVLTINDEAIALSTDNENLEDYVEDLETSVVNENIWLSSETNYFRNTENNFEISTSNNEDYVLPTKENNLENPNENLVISSVIESIQSDRLESTQHFFETSITHNEQQGLSTGSEDNIGSITNGKEIVGTVMKTGKATDKGTEISLSAIDEGFVVSTTLDTTQSDALGSTQNIFEITITDDDQQHLSSEMTRLDNDSISSSIQHEKGLLSSNGIIETTGIIETISTGSNTKAYINNLLNTISIPNTTEYLTSSTDYTSSNYSEQETPLGSGNFTNSIEHNTGVTINTTSNGPDDYRLSTSEQNVANDTYMSSTDLLSTKHNVSISVVTENVTNIEENLTTSNLTELEEATSDNLTDIRITTKLTSTTMEIIKKDTIKDIAYYLRAHKFNEYDRRYETNALSAPRSYYKEFPRPPLRSLHWEVRKYCEPSFHECVEYLRKRLRYTALKRSDDTAIVMREQNWNMANNSEQIKLIDEECKKLRKIDNEVADPFQGPLERFQWRSTASYYMCWYTMQQTPELEHLSERCDNFANCLDSNLGPNNQDQRANDDHPYSCALYSFCPDPCCADKHLIRLEGCWNSQDNPCFEGNPPGQRECAVNRSLNTDFRDIILNRWNVTCKCPKAGHEWNSLYGMCVDVDECTAATHNCDRKLEACVNLEGSFRCACKWGHIWDEGKKTCVPSSALGVIKLGRRNEGGDKNKEKESFLKRIIKFFKRSNDSNMLKPSRNVFVLTISAAFTLASIF